MLLEGESGNTKGIELTTRAQSNRLRDDQLVEVIMGKGKESARSEYPDFWRDIGVLLPATTMVF